MLHFRSRSPALSFTKAAVSGRALTELRIHLHPLLLLGLYVFSTRIQRFLDIVDHLRVDEPAVNEREGRACVEALLYEPAQPLWSIAIERLLQVS